MRLLISLLALVCLPFSVRAAGSTYPYDASTWAAGDFAVYDVYDLGVHVGTLTRQISQVTDTTVTLRGELENDLSSMFTDLKTETVYSRATSNLLSVSVDGKELDINQWNFGQGQDDVAVVPAGEFNVKKYDAIDYVGEKALMWMNSADTCLDGIVKMKRDVGLHSFTFKLKGFKCTAHP